MLSNELEYCLNDAFHQAREARHEYLTVEHLLLAILDTPKVREVLRACGADLAKLKQELRDHIEQSTPRLEEGEEREVQPTLGFQRVLLVISEQVLLLPVQLRGGETKLRHASGFVQKGLESALDAVFLYQGDERG